MMKTQPNINWPNNINQTNNTAALSGFLLGNLRRSTALLAAAATGVFLAAQTSSSQPPQAIGAVFVIAMENHNLNQLPTKSIPYPILYNSASPLMNSPIT